MKNIFHYRFENTLIKAFNILSMFFIISTFYTFFTSSLFACTIVYHKNPDGTIVVGKNSDLDSPQGLLWFIPPSGGKHGMVLLEQLGVDMPYEGINTSGLYVAITAVPFSWNIPNILRPTRISLQIVREILESSNDVHSAIELFRKRSIVFGTLFGNPMVHYFLADKFGNTAVVEFVNNQLHVIEGENVLTNHYLSADYIKPDNPTSLSRYKKAKALIENSKGIELTPMDILSILESVKQTSTVWNTAFAVRNVSNKAIVEFYIKNANDDVRVFNVKTELEKGMHLYNLETFEEVDKDSIALADNMRRFLVKISNSYGPLSSSSMATFSLLVNNAGYPRIGVECIVLNQLTEDNSQTNLYPGINFDYHLLEQFNLAIGIFLNPTKPLIKLPIFSITFDIGIEPDNWIPYRPLLFLRSMLKFTENNPELSFYLMFGSGLRF
uniref:Linear amide C-N hydrolase n=1 Tax=Fervidobacterium pennivorans TaxID=93466 RepID=A0A7V4NGJ8_FERPE